MRKEKHSQFEVKQTNLIKKKIQIMRKFFHISFGLKLFDFLFSSVTVKFRGSDDWECKHSLVP